MDENNHDNAFDRTAKVTQIQSSRMIFFPGGEVESTQAKGQGHNGQPALAIVK